MESLEKTEWSPVFARLMAVQLGHPIPQDFEQLMRNRLVMGALRYGLLNQRGKRQYDRIAGARKRLSQFKSTLNLECLVDIANMALLEFEEGVRSTRMEDYPLSTSPTVEGIEEAIRRFETDLNKVDLVNMAATASVVFQFPPSGAKLDQIHGDHCCV